MSTHRKEISIWDIKASKEPNQSNMEQRKLVEPIHQVLASFISTHAKIGAEFWFKRLLLKTLKEKKWDYWWTLKVLYFPHHKTAIFASSIKEAGRTHMCLFTSFLPLCQGVFSPGLHLSLQMSWSTASPQNVVPLMQLPFALHPPHHTHCPCVFKGYTII